MSEQTPSSRLTAGDPAPSFSGVNQNGDLVSSEGLTGTKLVLYFYPKAFTPGCTTESCDFRDRYQAFSTKGYTILGLSPDTPDKLTKFREEHELPFDLISDPDHAIASAFGAYGKKTNYGREYMGVIRSTFMIDASGVVEDAFYNVRAKGHGTNRNRSWTLMGHIKTAVFPIAGFGTRFLPATKAMPKVLLPIVDQPLIQFAVDEALASGIESLIFVTGRGHYAVEDYFDMSYELETNLMSRGQEELADSLKRLRPGPGQIAYVRQTEPLGLGHAVWCARNLVGDEPFAVLLADELIVSEEPNLARMISIQEHHGGNVVLVSPVDPETTDQYGIITPDHEHEDIIHVSDVVEKPSPGSAPSDLALVGRYVLDPSIMDILSSTDSGAGDEIQLTDAIRTSIATTGLHATRVNGDRYDCGSKTGFLEATIRLSLERPELGDTVRGLATEIAADQRPHRS